MLCLYERPKQSLQGRLPSIRSHGQRLQLRRTTTAKIKENMHSDQRMMHVIPRRRYLAAMERDPSFPLSARRRKNGQSQARTGLVAAKNTQAKLLQLSLPAGIVNKADGMAARWLSEQQLADETKTRDGLHGAMQTHTCQQWPLALTACIAGVSAFHLAAAQGRDDILYWLLTASQCAATPLVYVRLTPTCLHAYTGSCVS